MIKVGGRWPTSELLRQLIGNYGDNHPNTLFVNYGPRRPEDTAIASRATRVLNPTILSKFEQGRKLYSSGTGLPVSTDPQSLISAGYYMLLERRPEHRGGSDIRIYTPRQTPMSENYYTPYVHADKEIRVWAMCGEVFAIYRKKLAQGSQPTGYPFVKSHRNGWVFELVSKTDWTRQFGGNIVKIRRVAKDALLASRLEFGALDMGLGLATPAPLTGSLIEPEIVAFEVNAAPGVQTERSVGLRKLAKRIKAYHDATFGLINGYPYGPDSANARLDEEDSDATDDER